MSRYEIFNIFTYVASLYKFRMQSPTWKRYPNYLENSLDAIKIFLDGYAFERQGRNPSYPHAAVDAITSVSSRQQSKDFAKIVWESFSTLLHGKGLNIKVNPLYHTEKQCSCVWCKTGSNNIILRAREAISKSQVRDSWEEVKSIRGIGPKIASLFLRDISVRFELNPSQDRCLLQPVDVWVRRTVSMLNNFNMNDEDISKFLVENSNEPEKLNQGIWYFSTQIAGSLYRLYKSLHNLEYASIIMQEHKAILKDTAIELDNLMEPWVGPRQV